MSFPYDKETIDEFLCSVDMVSAFEDFVAKKTEEMKSKPIGERAFRWNGHLSRACYECSGDDFNDDTDVMEYLNGGGPNVEVGLKFFDKNSKMWFPDGKGGFEAKLPTIDDTFIQLKDLNTVGVKEEASNWFREIIVMLLNGKDWDEIDGGDCESCYLFDEFGFTSEETPTDEELREWVDNLYVDREAVENEIDGFNDSENLGQLAEYFVVLPSF